MKTYLFNLDKYGHDLSFAYESAKNNEKWEEAREIDDVIACLEANRVSYAMSAVPFAIWQKAKTISDGAQVRRVQCNLKAMGGKW